MKALVSLIYCVYLTHWCGSAVVLSIHLTVTFTLVMVEGLLIVTEKLVR